MERGVNDGDNKDKITSKVDPPVSKKKTCGHCGAEMSPSEVKYNNCRCGFATGPWDGGIYHSK